MVLLALTNPLGGLPVVVAATLNLVAVALIGGGFGAMAAQYCRSGLARSGPKRGGTQPA
jgi:hypothetical protein